MECVNTLDLMALMLNSFNSKFNIGGSNTLNLKKKFLLFS